MENILSTEDNLNFLEEHIPSDANPTIQGNTSFPRGLNSLRRAQELRSQRDLLIFISSPDFFETALPNGGYFTQSDVLTSVLNDIC